jgi:hypothetical protein
MKLVCRSLLIFATLGVLTLAQPIRIAAPVDCPASLAPALSHYLGGAAATVTNTSAKAIETVTFQLRTGAGVSFERVPVDIRPGDKERVIVQMAGSKSARVHLAGAELTIVSVEFAGGSSWGSVPRNSIPR